MGHSSRDLPFEKDEIFLLNDNKIIGWKIGSVIEVGFPVLI
jgi:hypothetical protein